MTPKEKGTRWADRVGAVDWDRVSAELGRYGCALTGPLLLPDEAAQIAAMYPGDSRFRPTAYMSRNRFGEGSYRYFTEPFPGAVIGLRQAFYPRLLPIAQDWWAALGREAPWPDTLDEWPDGCLAAGQIDSMPILHEYRQGDGNALHGEPVFPLQVAISFSNPGAGQAGGEFLLYEQRLRAQSRATATPIPLGHGLVFATRDRPFRPAQRWSAGPVRHAF